MRSTRHTFAPYAAARRAHAEPPLPPPITKRSYIAGTILVAMQLFCRAVAGLTKTALRKLFPLGGPGLIHRVESKLFPPPLHKTQSTRLSNAWSVHAHVHVESSGGKRVPASAPASCLVLNLSAPPSPRLAGIRQGEQSVQALQPALSLQVGRALLPSQPTGRREAKASNAGRLGSDSLAPGRSASAAFCRTTATTAGTRRRDFGGVRGSAVDAAC